MTAAIDVLNRMIAERQEAMKQRQYKSGGRLHQGMGPVPGEQQGGTLLESWNSLETTSDVLAHEAAILAAARQRILAAEARVQPVEGSEADRSALAELLDERIPAHALTYEQLDGLTTAVLAFVQDRAREAGA